MSARPIFTFPAPKCGPVRPIFWGTILCPSTAVEMPPVVLEVFASFRNFNLGLVWGFWVPVPLFRSPFFSPEESRPAFGEI